MKAGVAEVDITPPVGLKMDGYLERVEASVGVHDPLMAQVLVLDDGQRRAAIVALDTLAVSAGFSQLIRGDLALMLGTVTDAILVCASHTHAGPAGLQNWFPAGKAPPLDAALVARTRERISRAAAEALARLAPARMQVASGDVSGVGGDRNQPGHVSEPRVTVLRFDELDGAPLALLLHYACHPTTLGATNRQFSADFPGTARSRLREVYPTAIPLYVNGAAGNVSPRYFRRDQSFMEVRRLGRLLADRAIEALRDSASERMALAWDAAPVSLSLRAFDLRAQAPPVDDARQKTVRAEGLALQTQLARRFTGQSAQVATVYALRVGRWCFLGVPGEPFAELAGKLRAAAPGALIVGYCNDYLGYFPTQAAIDAGTYEALSSPYDARALTAIEVELRNLLRRLAMDASV